MSDQLELLAFFNHFSDSFALLRAFVNRLEPLTRQLCTICALMCNLQKCDFISTVPFYAHSFNISFVHSNGLNLDHSMGFIFPTLSSPVDVRLCAIWQCGKWNQNVGIDTNAPCLGWWYRTHPALHIVNQNYTQINTKHMAKNSCIECVLQAYKQESHRSDFRIVTVYCLLFIACFVWRVCLFVVIVF